VMQIQRVAIVGLGLMGGSLARALAARDVTVLGFDSVPDSLDAAEGEGIVHVRLPASLDGIESADVVVFALPVDATLALLRRIATRLSSVRLITDLASTKRSVVQAASELGLGRRYVGSHPLTGSHRSGWRASRAGLFDEARVFVCPTSATEPDALEMAEGFWRGLRAGVEVIDATAHDEQMAWRSHLPHVLACALGRTLREEGITRSALGPGGRDMTRLAGSAPALWRSIIEDNVDAMSTAIEAFDSQLRVLRDALDRRDSAAMHDFFVASSGWFDGDPV
jgi:prephenate dehydrogenase